MYQGYLKSFYKKYPEMQSLTYGEQYDKLLSDTSEPVGSYTRMFNRLGVETECIITNAEYLQKKWRIENGFASINKSDLVLEQVKKFKPDVLWIEGFDYTEKKWTDKVRQYVPCIRLLIGFHCAPFNLSMLENFRNLDFVLTCTPGLKHDFETNGLKTFLVYHAFDSTNLDKIRNENPFPENDFVFSGSLFIGGGFHDKRIELLENILKENIDLKIYGNLEKLYKTRIKQFLFYIFKLLNYLKLGNSLRKFSLFHNNGKYSENLITSYSKRLTQSVYPPVFGVDMLRLLNKSKIVLNMHGDVAGEYAGNIRLFEATGVGSCLLTDNKKNLADLFDIDKEIVVYNGIDDCIEKIKWLLENEEDRNRIAIAGQKKTLTVHTVEDRCRTIISIINEELSLDQKH
jgi:spore maturation protein CgeB